MKHMKNAEEALIYFKNALAIQRKEEEAKNTSREIYKELNNEQEAESFFHQAAALDPKYAYEIQKEPTTNSSSL